MIDILILNYNDAETAIELATILEKYELIHHILIVDNCSSDDSISKIQNVCNDKIICTATPKNGGYGYGNNYGIRYLKETDNPDYILLANPDVIVSEETLRHLLDFLHQHEEYAIVSPFMLDKQGRRMNNTAFKVPTCWKYIMSMGLLYSKYIRPFQYENIKSLNCDFFDVGAVAGSLFLMDTNKMLQYGMYDENMFLYCEETVLGLKFQRSPYKMALIPKKTYIHNHSVSINKSIKTSTDKHRILLRSKLYVIKNYYRANKLQMFIAKLMSAISIWEVWLLSLRSK